MNNLKIKPLHLNKNSHLIVLLYSDLIASTHHAWQAVCNQTNGTLEETHTKPVM